MKDRFTQGQIHWYDQRARKWNYHFCQYVEKHGIGVSTFYRWKGQYGGMTLSEAERLKHLEIDKGKATAWIRSKHHIIAWP